MTSIETDNEFIKKIKIYYHQMVHIPLMLTNLKSEFPQYFIGNVINFRDFKELQEKINSEIAVDLSRPTNAYCLKFLKMVIDTVESQKLEVNDTLLDNFMQLFSAGSSSTSSDNNECYKSYCIRDNQWVTVKNETAFNLVGMTTWGAAYQLSDFILGNKHLFENKRILELGSGTGLIGLVLKFISNLKSVVLTDYSPKVLYNLRDNLLLNNIQCTDSIDLEINENPKEVDENIFKVRLFDWEIPDIEHIDQCLDLQSDIILGADIVYEPSLCKYLVAILNRILCNSTSSVAYISSTIRNEQTFGIFKNEIKSFNNLIVEDITSTANLLNPSPFIYDGSQIVLYKIYNKQL
ncbi:hypothetical protein DLAC_11127 [Tieghemostelium lacteum]|uniref:FAM86 N-terminal domain-containing protein n=1 Tax=Tieghemostelium lacteum TaxID=361077 RepID=A0A151Z383_TIELA|nr:hypothetical protein DLAC_11127 [Tieghemostelium lacteum]|eukprot:KYQ88422.1 hypothetical protein DLAC_11127 [Tieghemostelium lacteum]